MAVARSSKKTSRKLNVEELAEALKEQGFLSEVDFHRVLKMGRISQHHPLNIIASQRMINADNGDVIDIDWLVDWLSEFSGVDTIEIDPLKLEIEKITKVLPKAFIKRIKALPVLVNEDKVIFATAEPFDKSWMLDTMGALKKDIEIRLAAPDVVDNLIEDFYEVRSAISSMAADDEEVPQLKSTETVANVDDGDVAKVVDWIFNFAQKERATDIHLEPREGQGIMRFRIDGELKVVYNFEGRVFLPLLSRIKILANMKVDEKRRPQDGRVKRKLRDGRVMEMRLSTIPTQYGEKLVIRIFDPLASDKTFTDLGFSEEDATRWKKIIESSYGMVLVTGPTGSGKTTTLQTSLTHLARPEVNICTVEDPVEIINENFNQVQVHSDINLTFGNAIRAFLRQDPDIIMVGEIRDQDAADMAIQASLTGHLVLSTLHTNTALGAITRLIDLGVEHHLLSATLLGVMGQRLVKVLCPHCKEKVETPKAIWEELVTPYKVATPEFVYQAKGCKACKNTGYHGRVVIYELVPMTEKLREIIHAKVRLSDLEAATRGLYLPLRLSGAQKVIKGITSIEEVLSVAR